MSRAQRIIFFLIPTVIGVAVLLWFKPSAGVRRTDGPMQQSVYVWQRQHTGAVKDAVAGAGAWAGGVVYLSAEIAATGGPGGGPSVQRADVDFDGLKRLGKPVGIAIRIGRHDGAFDPADPMSRAVAETAEAELRRARDAGLTPSEVQLDFDCAESKLDGYRLWVVEVVRRAGATPVSVTTLPSWLDRPAFRPLVASATGGYVLQVHSVDRPTSPDAPFKLCDAERAAAWVEEAARRSPSPFRLALPAYGYEYAFDSAGKPIGIQAETPRDWPAGTRLRRVMADPAEMAELVRRLQSSRPIALQSIIWYRLPTADDRLAWPARTLAAVAAGRTPMPLLSAATTRPTTQTGTGVRIDLVVSNAGDGSAGGTVDLKMVWDDASLIAADGVNGFILAEMPDPTAKGKGRQVLVLSRRAAAGAINPGGPIDAGWLRLERDTEVRVEVVNNNKGP